MVIEKVQKTPIKLYMFLLLHVLFMDKHTNGGMLPKGRIFCADTPDGKVGFVPNPH